MSTRYSAGSSSPSPSKSAGTGTSKRESRHRAVDGGGRVVAAAAEPEGVRALDHPDPAVGHVERGLRPSVAVVVAQETGTDQEGSPGRRSGGAGKWISPRSPAVVQNPGLVVVHRRLPPPQAVVVAGHGGEPDGPLPDHLAGDDVRPGAVGVDDHDVGADGGREVVGDPGAAAGGEEGDDDDGGEVAGPPRPG